MKGLAGLILLLALFAGAPAARADYRESYRKGIQAMDLKEWSDMARWMQKAAAEQPQEGGELVKIYGVRFEPYLPQYYLGLALFHSNDCAGALARWKESEQQGAVQRTTRYEDLKKSRTLCRPATDPAVLAQALRDAEAEVDKAKAAQIAVARLRSDPAYAEAWKQESSQGGSDLRGAELLGQARTELERGRSQQQVSGLEDARKLAIQARQELEALAGRVDRRHGEILQAAREEEKPAKQEQAGREGRPAEDAEQRQQEELARLAAENRERAERRSLEENIGRAARDAGTVLASARGTKGGKDLQRRQDRLKQLVKRSATLSGGLSLEELKKLSRELPAATSALEEALLAAQGREGPPAELRAAARALFRAEYREVVSTLEKASFPERRSEIATHLLLAAARYALFLESGGKEAELRQQALENVRACRRLDPKLAPDPRIFSPRFLELFKSAG